MQARGGQAWSRPATLGALAATGVLAAGAVMLGWQCVADDGNDPQAPVREHPAPGTRFWFEVIQSFNAKYEGDTAGHVGRGGGLTLHPHVALGDLVYHTVGDVDRSIGSVTGLTWERLRGSLTVEFRPHAEHRIAVGDAVWIDLNPVLPHAREAAAGGTGAAD